MRGALKPCSRDANRLLNGFLANIRNQCCNGNGLRFTVGLGRAGLLHREQDVFRGTPVLVGGGNWLYAAPGFGLLIGHGINMQAEIKLPLYRSLSNKQLDSPAIFQFGISRAF